MENICIRPARPSELAAVAGLRWEWLVENGSEDLGEPDDFVRHFVAWAGENAHTRAPRRASGDLQCVYVVPEARDGGLGGRLVRAVLDEARELGLERVTVHSSSRAIPAYARSGFEESPRLLQARIAPA